MSNFFRNHANTATPKAVWTLIALNTLVFLVQSAFPRQASLERTQLVPSDVAADPTRKWPTLVSSMFSHANLIHLVFNSLALYQFGRPLEARENPWTVSLVYLLGGIGSNLIYTLLNRDSNVGLIGASGGVSAVLAAYFLAYQETGNFAQWAMFQLLGALLSSGSGISYASHIYGSIIGALAYLLIRKRQQIN